MMKLYTIILILFFIPVVKSVAQKEMLSTVCDVYMDPAPLNRTTTYGDENVAPGIFEAVAQRYNALSGSIKAVTFWGRVDSAVAASNNVKVVVYTINGAGLPNAIQGQTTATIMADTIDNQVTAIFSSPVSVSFNTIISIEPVFAATDNFFIRHNMAPDGASLNLALVKQAGSWYNNLPSNLDPSYNVDFLILPIKLGSVTANYTYNSVGNVTNFTNSSTNAISYLWDFGDGNTSTSISPSHTYAASNTYNVKLKAYAGPGTCADSITTSISVVITGIDQSPEIKKNNLILSTNLVHDILTVEIKENMIVTIYNVLGAKVGIYDLKQNQSQQINIGNLQTGVYFIGSANFKPVKFVKI